MLLPGPRFSQLDAFAKVTTAKPKASVSVPPPVVTHCAAAAAFDVSNQSSPNRHAPVAFDGGGRITKDYNGIRYPRVPFVLYHIRKEPRAVCRVKSFHLLSFDRKTLTIFSLRSTIGCLLLKRYPSRYTRRFRTNNRRLFCPVKNDFLSDINTSVTRIKQ